MPVSLTEKQGILTRDRRQDPLTPELRRIGHHCEHSLRAASIWCAAHKWIEVVWGDSGQEITGRAIFPVPKTTAVDSKHFIPKFRVDPTVHIGLFLAIAVSILRLADGIRDQCEMTGIHGPQRTEVDCVTVHSLAHHFHAI